MHLCIIQHSSHIYRLTRGVVRDQRLIVEAENFSDIVEIWMLNNKRPLCVINLVVEISNRHLYTPVLLVVELHMPMHPGGAHVLCAV